MTDRIDKRISDELYILKAFAICSAIMAHSCYLDIPNSIDTYVLGRFAKFGVFAFYFLSGYVFKHESAWTFVKKIAVNLLCPWLFLGTCVHFGSMYYIEKTIRFDGFFDYIIGNGSTLYFCSVLLLIKCIFQGFTIPLSGLKASKKRITLICIGFIICSLCSLFVTALGILPQNYDSAKLVYQYVNPYLNVFNWIGIFAGGVLARQFSWVEFLTSHRRLKNLICMASAIIIIIGWFDNGCSYFSFCGVYVEFAFLILFFYLIDTIYPIFGWGGIVFVGKNTYPLFLMHYPVLALLMHGVQLRSSFIVGVIRPVLCIVILCAGICLAKILAKHFRASALLGVLTGIK